MTALQWFEYLLLGGLLGLLGQGVRAVVGLKKVQGSYDGFVPSRLVVSLLIGFLVGMAAALILKQPTSSSLFNLNAWLLVAIAALGYAGTDLIEGLSADLFAKPRLPGPAESSAHAIVLHREADIEKHMRADSRLSDDRLREFTPIVREVAKDYTTLGVNLGIEESEQAAARAEPVSPPPIESKADPRSVGLLFATTRAEAPEFSEGWFTGERAGRTTYGQAFVRIPEAHQIGKVEQPFKIQLFSLTLYEGSRDPTKHFVIRKVDILTESDWCNLIRIFQHDSALVFVHGFNTSFEEGLYRTAQIAWDLKFGGVPVLFSWPSRGRVADYIYDRESAAGARQAFIEMLQLIKAQNNIKRIHILAHSMGNQVVLEALMAFRQVAATLRLNELMMAAPDVDGDNYRNIAPIVRSITMGMTLYASSADKALKASKRLAGNISRAGDVPPGGPIVLPQIDSIDVTAMGEEILGLNHTVFAQRRSILNDVGILIQSGMRPPGSRLTDIRGVPEGQNPPQYWSFAR